MSGTRPGRHRHGSRLEEARKGRQRARAATGERVRGEGKERKRGPKRQGDRKREEGRGGGKGRESEVAERQMGRCTGGMLEVEVSCLGSGAGGRPEAEVYRV